MNLFSNLVNHKKLLLALAGLILLVVIIILAIFALNSQTLKYFTNPNAAEKQINDSLIDSIENGLDQNIYTLFLQNFISEVKTAKIQLESQTKQINGTNSVGIKLNGDADITSGLSFDGEMNITGALNPFGAVNILGDLLISQNIIYFRITDTTGSSSDVAERFKDLVGKWYKSPISNMNSLVQTIFAIKLDKSLKAQGAEDAETVRNLWQNKPPVSNVTQAESRVIQNSKVECFTANVRLDLETKLEPKLEFCVSGVDKFPQLFKLTNKGSQTENSVELSILEQTKTLNIQIPPDALDFN